MFARVTGAAMRGILVALMVATPSLLLPSYTSESPEMIALLAILAAVLTFAEYNTAFPSFIEFRDAPPLNRLRFVALFSMFLVLSLIALLVPVGIFAVLGAIRSQAADIPPIHDIATDSANPPVFSLSLIHI